MIIVIKNFLKKFYILLHYSVNFISENIKIYVKLILILFLIK
jgi:hypothetical protein